MPESTTTPDVAAKTATKASTKKPAAARRTSKPSGKRTAASKQAAAPRRAPSAAGPASVVDRTTRLSEEVLESVEAGQLAAIEAVRSFVETVDRALPGLDASSRRHEVVDSALHMAERLVHTQYDFIRKVVESASQAVERSDTKQSNGAG